MLTNKECGQRGSGERIEDGEKERAVDKQRVGLLLFFATFQVGDHWTAGEGQKEAGV